MVNAYPQAIEKTHENYLEVATSPYVKDYTQERKQLLLPLVPSDSKLLKFHQSLCPTCVDEEKWEKMKVDALTYARDGKVWIVKNCPEHGSVRELYWGDYDMFRKAEKFQDPGIKILNPNIDKSEFEIDCPNDCGLCVEHESHTGLGNIVLTNRCDLTCWYCLSFDVEVPFKINGKVEIRKIGDIAELFLKNSKEIEVDGIKGVFAPAKNIQALTIENEKHVWKNVNKFLKRKYSGDFIKIRTRSGKEIKTTIDHRFILSSLERKNAFSLQKGEKLLSVWNLSTGEADKIDLFEAFKSLPEEETSSIYAKHSGVFDDINKIKTSLISLGQNPELAYSWKFRDTIPLNVLYTLNPQVNGISFGVDAKSYEVNRFLKITPELARIVGYFVSDGHYSGKKLCITAKDEWVRKDISSCLEKLGVSYSIVKSGEKAEQIFIGNKIFYLIFKHVFEIPKGARNKRLPKQFLNFDPESKVSLLSGLFNGDGFVEVGERHGALGYGTVSKDLANDLTYLLANVGIASTVYERDMANNKLSNYNLYRFYISSENFEKMKSLLSFKQSHLDRLAKIGKREKSKLEAFGDFLIDEIKEIETVKNSEEQDVYDLEIDSDSHSFVAGNGILISNCFFYAKEGEPIYEPTLDQIKFMLKRMRDEKPVGANAVQLSLDRNEKILVRNKQGVSSHVKIGDFVDRIMKQNGFEEFSNPIIHEKSDINGWEVMTIDNKLKSVFKPIKSVIRHENKNDMFKLVTTQGWEITTTGSHSVFVFDNGSLVAKPVTDIGEGDVLVGCLNTPEFNEISNINLLDLIKERGPQALEKIVVTDFSKEDLKKYEDQEGIKINWDSVSFKVYNKGIRAGNAIRYFNSKKGKELPIKLEVTPELCRLLGYYVGEGCTYKSGVIFTFSSKEEDLVEDLIYCVRKVFGETNIRKSPLLDSAVQIYIEGYLYKLFFEILGCGERAIEKQVPWLIFNVGDDLKKEFLRTYFKCDGNVKMRNTGFEINHNTASKDLASDLIILHSTLGIIPRVEVSESKPHFVEKTGQFISKVSKKYRLVVGGKEMLSKALWYLDKELRERFESYISTPEKHTPTYLRIPISEGIKQLASTRVNNEIIHNMLHRMKYDKSVSKNNLMEVTNYFNQNDIDFNRECNDISHSDLGFFEILRIEKINQSTGYVYDISVPDSEAFFAGTGPLLAHNTGGEPTLREDLIDIIKAGREIGYEHIQLNTNGINLAKSPQLAKDIHDAGSHILYMSFDGMTPATNPKNYWEAQGALDSCKKAGLGIVLVPTVIGGVNDHELGDIIRFAAGNIDVIRSVNFQPVSLVGRMPEKLRMQQRITIPGAIKRIEEQTDGQIGKEFWFPVPCAKQVTDFIEALKSEPKYRLSIHFACGMATYVFKEEGTNNLIPLPKFFDVESFFAYLGELTRDIQTARFKKVGKALAVGKLMTKFNSFIDKKYVPRGLHIKRMLMGAIQGNNYHGLADFHHNSLFLGMMHFQDPYNWDIDRIHKCDIHYASPDGRVIPFCTFNVIPELYRDSIQRKFSIPTSQWEQTTGKKLIQDKIHRKLTPEQMQAIKTNYDKYRRSLVKVTPEPDWSWKAIKEQEALGAANKGLKLTSQLPSDIAQQKIQGLINIVAPGITKKPTMSNPAAGGSGCGSSEESDGCCGGGGSEDSGGCGCGH